jgi:hypothetical protein
MAITKKVQKTVFRTNAVILLGRSSLWPLGLVKGMNMPINHGSPNSQPKPNMIQSGADPWQQQYSLVISVVVVLVSFAGTWT